MKMMGLSQWILWTTWFIKQFLFLLIPIIVMTVLLKVGGGGGEEGVLDCCLWLTQSLLRVDRFSTSYMYV